VSARRATGGRREVVAGFDRFGGLHCETSVVRKVLGWAGLDRSEETLLGLGGGIGFIYWWRKGMPAPLVGGRNGGNQTFIETLSRRLHQPMRFVTTRSMERAHERLMARLAVPLPAICYGDVFYLTYLGTRHHFGGHCFVVYGVDEPAGEALISDRSAVPLSLGLEELRQARNSSFPPFPPHNALLELDPDPGRQPGRGDFLLAVRDCVTAMTSPPIANLGLAGFETLRKVLAGWLESSPPADLLDKLLAVFANVELGGTGGSAFRKMYRGFLAENAAVIDHPALPAARARLDEVVAAWEGFVAALLPRELPPLHALGEELRRRSRAFEEGRFAEAAGAESPPALRQEAAAALAADRKALRPLDGRLRELAAAEERFFGALAQVAAAAPAEERRP
jgi:hypothetical protein